MIFIINVPVAINSTDKSTLVVEKVEVYVTPFKTYMYLISIT